MKKVFLIVLTFVFFYNVFAQQKIVNAKQVWVTEGIKLGGVFRSTWPDGSGGIESWNLTGNPSTNPSANFIGTTNNQPINFRTNNVLRGIFQTDGKLNWILNGIFNGVQIGRPFGETTNIAVGGVSSSTGWTAGTNTTIVGQGAALLNTTGSGLSVFGANGLRSNTTGSNNAGFGNNAGRYNTTGSNQIFIGNLGRLNYYGDTTSTPIVIFENAAGVLNRTKINGELQISSKTQTKTFLIKDSTNNITADSSYSFTSGYVADSSMIQTKNYGAFAMKYNSGGSRTTVSGQGSFAFGKSQRNTTTNTPALETINGNGSGFIGFNSGGTVLIPSTAVGAVAIGALSRNTWMIPSGVGSGIWGYTTGAGDDGSKITVSGLGSHAIATAQNGGRIDVPGLGAFVSGIASTTSLDTSRIIANANAAHIFALAENGGQVTNYIAGGFLSGVSANNGKMKLGLTSNISHGSFMTGYSWASNSLIVSDSNANFTGGLATNDTLENIGTASFIYGRGLSNKSNYSILFGRGFTNIADSVCKIGWGQSTMTVNGKNRVGIGTSTPSQTLDVSGSFGASITTTATDLTLNETHFTVIIKSGTHLITLPAATSNNRRIYVLVNQTADLIDTGQYIDLTGVISTTIPETSSIWIQSDGSAYYQIK